MKWWFWTSRIFIVVGLIAVTIGAFCFALKGVSLGSGLELRSIGKAFLSSGLCLFGSGFAILLIISELKKNSS